MYMLHSFSHQLLLHTALHKQIYNIYNLLLNSAKFLLPSKRSNMKLHNW